MCAGMSVFNHPPPNIHQTTSTIFRGRVKVSHVLSKHSFRIQNVTFQIHSLLAFCPYSSSTITFLFWYVKYVKIPHKEVDVVVDAKRLTLWGSKSSLVATPTPILTLDYYFSRPSLGNQGRKKILIFSNSHEKLFPFFFFTKKCQFCLFF